MAEVTQPAQTRYTPDQTAIAEAVVQYPGLRPDDPAGTLKIVGWGNMAQEVQERCQPRQRFVFEGRLRMSTVERPEGFKEKLAELNVSKIHAMGTGAEMGHEPAENIERRTAPAPAKIDAGVGGAAAAPDHFPYDDIPF